MKKLQEEKTRIKDKIENFKYSKQKRLSRKKKTLTKFEKKKRKLLAGKRNV